MDPATVILMLAIHLLASSGLMALVWRRMPAAPGLGRWALASGLFGAAYLARLLAGLQGVDALGLASDGTMLLAVLLFGDGVREFVGRLPMPPRRVGLLALLMFGAEVAAAQVGGAQARHVALNAMIGLLYAQIAWILATERRRQGAPLQAPLALLVGIVGGLSALTLLRGAHIAQAGMPVAFHGPMAKVYYLFASVTAVVTALTLVWMMLLRLNGQLADLATRDALTGVFNRNGLAQALKQHFGQRQAVPLTLLLVDIDHFKRINDTLGHATGDAVLQVVACELTAQLRTGDFVARIGGEEFLIGCVGADPAVALALADRLRRTIGRLQVPAAVGSERVGCTASIGVSAAFDRFDGWEPAAAQADEALYRAKAAGRDGVQSHLATLGT
ncbi:GGDEF domain-containing protein [Rhizobacter sp. SG703]|uniref:GGDEF domain-containing protein n=1 Tax=Rhizobacter sp. SG703 TaxID=2587140 RepID=UPI00144713A0|nr:GGDEF domain-containing protein [Rhizobacter sp. SG703]NKI95160.1 diguanylate cyclase (GGDEF)-like protein [Rhizobacter sp. SG703]